MKNLNYILAFALVLGLTACGKKSDNRETISPRSGRTNPAGEQQASDSTAFTTSGFNGAIVGSPQSAFQNAVDAWVSSLINPQNELSTVSGDVNSNTGVRFKGFAELTSGVFNPSSGINAQVNTTTAKLGVLVWDAWAGQTDSSGNVVPGILMDQFNLVDGTITNKNVTLNFSDDQGTVRLQGVYDANYFYGTISFSNNKYWDGYAPGAQGTVGNFYIRTCDFFRCQ